MDPEETNHHRNMSSYENSSQLDLASCISLCEFASHFSRTPFLPEGLFILESFSHLLSFRFRNPDPMPMVGILGTASSGKSTLFNQIAGFSISKVTPIPHETTGPIMFGPDRIRSLLQDPSLFRPILRDLQFTVVPAGGLSGQPSMGCCVTSQQRPDFPCILMDLPDVGTLDSREENHVALRILPWLDRVLLVVTEESFAQNDHHQLLDILNLIHPDRARPEVFLVMNRVHRVTRNEEFSVRMEAVRALWPNAPIVPLCFLESQDSFPVESLKALTDESHPRVTRMLCSAHHRLTRNLLKQIQVECANREREHRRLQDLIEQELHEACRFRKAFLSQPFQERLDTYNPWRNPFRGIADLWTSRPSEDPMRVDLLDGSTVVTYVVQEAENLRRKALLHRKQRLGLIPDTPPPELSQDEKQSLALLVTDQVALLNRKARQDMEILLAALRERQGLKNPVWGTLAGTASLLFLLDLAIPTVGTMGTLLASGTLSALGWGGMITSDLMRRIKSSRWREEAERQIRTCMEESIDEYVHLLENEDNLLYEWKERWQEWIERNS